MANFTQSNITLLSHQLLTHAADGVSIKGSATSVASNIRGMVYVYHANVETTAQVNGARYKLQGTWNASGDEDWATLVEFVSNTTAVVTEDLNAVEPVAETVMAVTSTADFAPGDIVYIDDATATADGEWVEIASLVTNTTYTLVDGLTNAKAIGDDMYGPAEIFTALVDLSGISRVRMLVQLEGATGANIHLKAHMIAATDIV